LNLLDNMNCATRILSGFQGAFATGIQYQPLSLRGDVY